MKHAIWKGTLSFGLLNIPIEIMGAKEGKEVHFSLVDSKSLAPIKYKRVSEKTGKEIPYSQISKAFKLDSGKYVLMTDKDFEMANPKATQMVEIVNFVNMEELDPMFFEGAYYILPKKGGEKGYFLFRDALEKSGKVAIAKIVMRTKQHLCCTLVKDDYLILIMMRFSEQVLETHEAKFFDKKTLKKVAYSDAEKKMANQLIDSMTVKWEPDQYKDTYYKDIMKRIKLKSKKSFEMEKNTESKDDVEATDNVLDLTLLLEKSLKAGGGKKTAAKKKVKKKASKKKSTTTSKNVLQFKKA